MHSPRWHEKPTRCAASCSSPVLRASQRKGGERREKLCRKLCEGPMLRSSGESDPSPFSTPLVAPVRHASAPAADHHRCLFETPILFTFLKPSLSCIKTDISKQAFIVSSRSIIAPIGRKKSASTVLIPKKKHLAKKGTAQISAPARAPERNEAPWHALMAPWGLFTLYVRSTLG